MLFPQNTPTRSLVSLDGTWDFCIDPGRDEPTLDGASADLPGAEKMAVPASYNDLSQDAAVRDHIGWAWYQRWVTPSRLWAGQRLVLHFGSVAHHARVFIDGAEVARHKGGFLPFQVDISEFVDVAAPFRLAVAVDNRLDWSCLPCGEIKEPKGPQYPDGYRQQVIHFDFFNYAGIHRSVHVQVLPPVHVVAAQVDAQVDEQGRGQLAWVASLSDQAGLRVECCDAEGRIVASGSGIQGSCTLDEVHLWQPGAGYCYTLWLIAEDADGNELDRYPVRTGFRRIEVSKEQFLINGTPFYFRGFGKHEDSTLSGRAHNPVTLIKDLKLLGWINANSFRTSHYPYAEEVLDLCDELGIVVIDESPAVGLWDHSAPVFDCGKVGDDTLAHHNDVMSDLIARDRHHPCVVMWSVANEPASWEEGARPYFEAVVAHTRELDATRPLCCVVNTSAQGDRIQDLFDVTCLNRYPAWYSDPGRLETIEPGLLHDLREVHERFGKPIIITEYGADTVAGLHNDPVTMFSEEFQVEYLKACHRAFDALPFVIGEHVWNFADFMTKQGITRIIGNRKGVFTRDRQPKASAHYLRQRWQEASRP
ncbi:MAG: beta-glucuronidase [Planctomycetota bacterium]|nr:MAG: beta-glucuronidase [Planctomycetota bacterium]